VSGGDYTLPPAEVETGVSLALIEEGPPSPKLPPRQWVRQNLFNSSLNSAITIVFGVVALYLGFRFFRFLFLTAHWEPVRRNLTNFMMGRFPRDEQWRVIVQTYLLAGAAGLAWGAVIGVARQRTDEAGVESAEEPLPRRLRRYWALGLFVASLVVATRTVLPSLFILSALALLVGLQWVAAHLPHGARGAVWALALVVAVGSFQVVIGTGGSAWMWVAVPLAWAAVRAVGRVHAPGPLARLGLRIGAAVVVIVVVRVVYSFLEVDGVGWDKWEGLHLTVFSSFTAIVLAFPFGLLLALGRRSSFPAMRLMSTIYIELIRGVPLISLLLMGQFFIGFFLNTDNPLSQLTRAIAAMTLFTAAYVAEIVRGGLQAVPTGQVEASQALGLGPPATMRLIVLPQALRAVIPAMVGQFISLFKDSSLLSIVGILEFLGVRSIVHAQADFRNLGISETLVFVAFGFWAIAFTMSRESQRLERRLGVGER
jgi:general L-amino acid transport system permease protein